MSKAVEELNAQLEREAPGSLRHTVLLAARQFRSSWVDLGKLLGEVKRTEAWLGWGFDSFEAYYSTELRLKKPTVLKLTRSYDVLERFDGPALENARERRVAPAFEVVEVLANADRRGQLSETEYQAVRDSIWNNTQPPEETRKALLERFPAPPPREMSEEVRLRRMLAAARRVVEDARALAALPPAIGSHALALVTALEKALERDQQEAA